MKRPSLFHLLLFILIYGGLAFLCTGVRDIKILATVYWPAGGILLGTLMISPIPRWGYWLVLAAALHFLSGLFFSDHATFVTVIFVLTNIVSMAVIAYIWQRQTARQNTLTHPVSLLWFIGLVLAISVLGGAFATIFLHVFGHHHVHLSLWLTWALSNALGCLIGAPLVLAWSDFRIKRSGGPSWQDLGLGAAFFLFAVISTTVVFYGPFSVAIFGTTVDEVTYIPLLFVVLVAMVWEQRGATLVLVPFALIVGSCSLFQIGPFWLTQSFNGEALLDAQGYIAAAGLLALLMAALSSNHQRSLQQASAWKTRFEAALLSSRHLMYELDPRDEKITWGGDVRNLLGMPPEALESLQDFLQHVHPEDRQIVTEHVGLADLSAEFSEEDIVTHHARFRFKGNDGHYQTIVASGAPIIDFDGQIYKVEGLLSREETPAFVLPQQPKG